MNVNHLQSRGSDVHRVISRCARLSVPALVCVGLLMSPASRAQHPGASQIDHDEVVTTGDVPGGRECLPEDWEFATSQPAALALKKAQVALPTAHCRAVHLAVLPEADIVQLVGWQNTDVLVGVTLVRPDRVSPVAVIRFFGGMVEPFHSEQNKENLSAFNLLLKNYQPSDPNWNLAHMSKLYLFATGHGTNRGRNDSETFSP